MSDRRFSTAVRDRFIGLTLFVPSATVLVIARWLTPDPAGVGTHQQLGLAGCFFIEQWALPCPMCGMTTTFSLMAHFSPLQALMNQPFGVILFFLTLLGAVIGALEMIKPSIFLRPVLRWTLARDLALAGLLLAMLVAGWLYKIVLMRQMLPWSP